MTFVFTALWCCHTQVNASPVALGPGPPTPPFLKSLSPTLRLHLDLAVRCHHLALTLRLFPLLLHQRFWSTLLPSLPASALGLHCTATPVLLTQSCSHPVPFFLSYHQGALNVTAAINAPLVYFVSPQSWVTYTRGVSNHGQRGSVMKQVSGNDPGWRPR